MPNSTVSILAGTGERAIETEHREGTTTALFNRPSGVAVDGDIIWKLFATGTKFYLNPV